MFETELTIFIQRNEMYAKEDYQYLSPFKKMYPNKYVHAKKLQCLKLKKIFSVKVRKCMWKRNINLCILPENVSRQQLPIQKVSVFETENTLFSFEGEKCMWKKDINFCPLSKLYPDKYFHFKKMQCLKLNTLFPFNGTKCMQKKTINFCHLLKNVFRHKLPVKKNSVFKIEYTFLN